MPTFTFARTEAGSRPFWLAEIASGKVPEFLFVAAIAIFLVGQTLSGLTAPLSVDESFSATIATQPDFTSLIGWCLSELSGPVYYSLLWSWEKLVGDSNLAMRLLGLGFALAGPWLIWTRGHRDIATRRIWAVVVALWVPAIFDGSELRPYSLILFLGCAQAIAFLRLMEAPDTKRTALWAGLSALAVLTHYHAAVIAGLQGLAYLAVWRMRAVRTWPALLTLLPMAGWMAWHLPLMFSYAGSGGWYKRLDLAKLALIPWLVFGARILGAVMAAAMLTTLYAKLRGGGSLRPDGMSTAELALAGSGLGAFAIVFAIGFLWPSFVPRYLLAYGPAMLLVVPLWLRRVARFAPFAPALVVLAFMASAGNAVASRIAHPQLTVHHVFGFERPSRWIAEHSNARQLVFVWDNPIMSMVDRRRLAEVGGYFLRRQGRNVDVLIPRIPAKGDLNPAVMELAGPDSAIIWIYDKNVPGTLSVRYAPQARSDRKHWTCRDFGSGSIVVFACAPKQAAPREGSEIPA